VLARREDVPEILRLLLVGVAEHPLQQDVREADDRVERRPELVGHAGEELRLVLACHFQLMALDLELAEEARVLNGEGGLRGEGPEELDDFGGERAERAASDHEPSDETFLVEQRNGEHRARAGREHGAADPAVVGALRGDVRDLDRLPSHRHLADGAFSPTQARCPEHHGLAFVRIQRRARPKLFRTLVVLEDRRNMPASAGRPSVPDSDDREPLALLHARKFIAETHALVAGQDLNPWVFANTAGLPHDAMNLLHRWWGPLLEAAGMRRARFHDLRHTFASLLIQAGESLAYVRDQLGHSSIKITVDLYGHLVPGANRGAVDRLAESTAPSCTPAVPERPSNHQECELSIDDDGAGGGSRTRDLLITNQLLCL
jgi:hypothetical protein